MQITSRGIRPCAFCLRARRVVRDGLGRVFQRPATHVEYHIEGGVIIVQRDTGRVVGTPAGPLVTMLGRKVSAAKGKLTDESGKKVATYTRARKLHFPGNNSETITEG